jgi:hypothetical protein
MAAGFTLTDNTQTPQAPELTTATFSSVTFNTGASDVAIVFISYNTEVTGTSNLAVTIGGSSAAIIKTPVFVDSFMTAIAYGSLGALTTAAVVLTDTGVGFGSPLIIQAGKVTGVTGTAYATNVSSSEQNPASGMSVNIPSGGVGVGQWGAYFENQTISFSGSTNDPSGDGQIASAIGNGLSVGVAHSLTSGAPTTISVTATYGAFAMISFSASGSTPTALASIAIPKKVFLKPKRPFMLR